MHCSQLHSRSKPLLNCHGTKLSQKFWKNTKVASKYPKLVGSQPTVICIASLLLLEQRMKNRERASPASSPNQVLTHAARAAAKQLNLWPRAARAKGPGQGNPRQSKAKLSIQIRQKMKEEFVEIWLLGAAAHFHVQ